MPRLFATITEQELKAKILAPMSDDDRQYGKHRDIKTLTPQVEKDLNKVQFDMENMAEGPAQFCNGPDHKIMGLQTLENGFTFWGFQAGGDWETPVFFIIYWDGKRLRGYIPEDGNSFDKKTKMAFGNGQYAEEIMCPECRKISKKVCEECVSCPKCCCCANRHIMGVKDLAIKEDIHGDGPELDQDKIIIDIMNRIQPKMSG